MEVIKTNNNNIDKVIKARWINLDSAGLIPERLDQETLDQLLGWFIDEHGGCGGEALFIQSAIFDTVLEQRSLCFDARGRQDIRRECTVQFENGLIYGTWLLSKQEAGGPFPALLDLNQALESVRLYKMRPTSLHGAEDSVQLGGYLDELITLDSRIAVLIRACFRMVEGLFVDEEGTFNPQVLRFLFFAGLVAAGVRIPRLTVAKALRDPGEDVF